MKKADRSLLRRLEEENGYRRRRQWPEHATAARRELDAIRRVPVPTDARCDICACDKRLFRDHRHGTAVVRGFLCRNCNIGLGMFKDDIGLLDAAARYVAGALREGSTGNPA